MQWKPNVTVAAIAHRDGRFLIVEEKADGSAVFNQPAGHLERGETLIDAVRREVLEETGWEYEPECLVGIYLYPAPRSEVSYLRFCFAGGCVRHHPGRSLDEEIIRVTWMSRCELAGNEQRMRSPMVLRCIDDFLSGRSYPIGLLNHLSAASGQ